MQNSESGVYYLPRTPPIRNHLSARVFYGIILGGLLLGLVACSLGGWAYLEFGDRTPTGHRIWEGIARHFVIPICAMIGSTFGGLFGVAVAVALTAYGAGSVPTAKRDCTAGQSGEHLVPTQDISRERNSTASIGSDS
jgi:hypothetical protein